MAELPYTPISTFYSSYFGKKVYKVPVSIVDDCPNRRGLKGMQVCIFCDEWGSAAYPQQAQLDLITQIAMTKQNLIKRYKAEGFLVYFQAYTNSFAKISHLQESFATSLKIPDVLGFVVGTRPDCISDGVLKLWQEYHEKSFVAVELGVQSFFDDQLEFLKRGHTAQQSIDAIKRISESTNVNLGIHLMFGLPHETDEHILETARLVRELPIQNVKLHNLHVLTNTPLAELFHEGKFEPIGLDEYTRRVILFLQNIPKSIAVHRLNAVASRWNELIAPEWTRHKMLATQKIIDDMNLNKFYQGQFV
jgi:uncharacterized protein